MEHVEPLVAAPAEPSIHPAPVGAEQPAPTAAEEQLADGVFSREQGHVAHALLGLSAGVGLLHHLAAETFGNKDKEEAPPRPPRRADDPPVP